MTHDSPESLPDADLRLAVAEAAGWLAPTGCEDGFWAYDDDGFLVNKSTGTKLCPAVFRRARYWTSPTGGCGDHKPPDFLRDLAAAWAVFVGMKPPKLEYAGQGNVRRVLMESKDRAGEWLAGWMWQDTFGPTWDGPTMGTGPTPERALCCAIVRRNNLEKL